MNILIPEFQLNYSFPRKGICEPEALFVYEKNETQNLDPSLLLILHYVII